MKVRELGPQVRIDPEFAQVLPRPSDSEQEELRSSLQERGCLDPLRTWRGLLVDGHTRYALCQELGVRYRTEELDLPDREAVRMWIWRFQLARRNLTPRQLAFYRGQLANMLKRDKQENLRSGSNSPRGQIEPSGRTADAVARQVGVSASTIKRDQRFANDLDVIAESAGAQTRDAILSGALPLTRADVSAVAEQHPSADVVERFSDRRARMREQQAIESDPKPFRQSSIVETRTYVGEDGVEYVDSVLLRCGHEYKYSRAVRADRTRKSAPCRVCGGGTRQATERRRAEAEARRSITSAIEDPAKRDALVRLVGLAVRAAAEPQRMHRIAPELGQVVSELGLVA